MQSYERRTEECRCRDPFCTLLIDLILSLQTLKNRDTLINLLAMHTRQVSPTCKCPAQGYYMLLPIDLRYRLLRVCLS